MEEMISRFDKIEIRADMQIEALNENKIKEEKQRAQEEQKQVSKGSESIVKIDKMRFPAFNGDIQAYPQFKEEFHKHLAPLCSKDKLAFVLKGYLSPSVQEEVSSCGENYSSMWDRLDLRYGDKDRLINTILDEVAALPQQGRNGDILTP